MSTNLPHLFLKNLQGLSKKFDMSRNIDNEEVAQKPADYYRRQKERLRASFQLLRIKRRERNVQRTLEIPAHIDYVQVHFYIVFGDSAPFKTKTKFENDFGLSPVMFTNLNQSVLFAISDEGKFAKFVELLRQFVASSDRVHPGAENYYIITTIHDFEFLSTEKVLGYARNHLVLEIVNTHPHIYDQYEAIKESLFKFLNKLRREGRIGNYDTDKDTSIEILGISEKDLLLLTDNFDILCAAHSLRTATIRPDIYNQQQLSWGITISPSANGQLIGILDNGVRPIEPISDVIIDAGIDITTHSAPNATQASHPHGTIVASLAAVGTKLFETGQTDFVADANILPIKILRNFDGTFQVYSLINAIKQAVHDYKVRIFNLSVCGQGKMYNEEPSVLAYQLDRLAYELDILIFIATGNLDEGDLQAMQSPEHGDHPFHQYPNHFYDPETSTDCHVCEATNICTPAESLNNITVGAIADNLREDGTSHLTLSKELPAFYTRKNHYDYSKSVNGTTIKQSQTNSNIAKPDIVMPGGDRLNPEAGMQVLGFGDNGNDYYLLDSGTSLATPLAANLAAKIWNRYPKLSPQTVKALIINSAERVSDSFLEDVESRIKNRLSQAKYGMDFNELSQGQKTQVSKGFSRKNLYRSLVGYGQPREDVLLNSTDKSVTIVLEDTIASRTHRVIPIAIPRYLLEREQSKRLYIKATLCFKTFPAWGNHLDYNPLHISFNFAKAVDSNPHHAANIIADRENEFYDQFYQTEEIRTGTDQNEINKLKNLERKKALGIKKTLERWSEDYFPPVNKPFSNTQQLDIHIRKEEIEKVSGKIMMAIRCVLKENLPPPMRAWADAQDSHPFSIVLSITDETTLFDDYSLYDELKAINQLVPIVELAGEAEAAEAIAES